MSLRKLSFSLLASCLLCIGHSQILEASTSREIFAKYPNAYFIETGSHLGDGIQMAFDVGFKQIYSIELGPHLFNHCRNLFASFPNVTIIQGNSANVLPLLLADINAPATFWLDGHYSSGNTARGNTNTPILAELEAISKHPIKTHTIMIDDVRLFGTIEFDFIELDEIIQNILEINPNYTILYENGIVPNDVLVAKIGS